MSVIRLPWLDGDSDFPPVTQALTDPPGLLAGGGDLSPQRLLLAYSRGIFPWYGPQDPLLWWSPDPRLVLQPSRIRVRRSLAKVLRNRRYRVCFNSAFEQVMRACAEPRGDGHGTWISEDMVLAYRELHRLGYAHSVETWHGDQLVGGLYGVCIGRMFYGESMFSRVPDSSKIALVYLCRVLQEHGYPLIDCQMETSHLLSMGAQSMPRMMFCQQLAELVVQPSIIKTWNFQFVSAAGD